MYLKFLRWRDREREREERENLLGGCKRLFRVLPFWREERDRNVKVREKEKEKER